MPNSFSYEEFIDQKPEIVFDLISDFTDYKNFLPGCINSESISSSESFDIGRLEFNFFKYKITKDFYCASFFLYFIFLYV